MSINTLANLAINAGLDNTLNENYIIKEFEESICTTLNINEEVLHCDASVVPVHNCDGTHVITLESLVEVSEAYESSLEEAMKIIKEANQLETDLVCALPSNINEEYTVQEFCELMETLNENNIIVSLDRELVCEDFITEGQRIDNIKAKMSEILDKLSSEAKLERTIADAKKKNEKLRTELEAFNAMSKEGQNDYIQKNMTKLKLGVIGTLVGSNMMNRIVIKTLAPSIYSPLIGTIVLYYASSRVLIKAREKSGKPVEYGAKQYINSINNTIKLNEDTIKAAEVKLNKIKKDK